MEMEINVPVLAKTYYVNVSSGDTFRKAKNRSFSNVSPCCRTELKIDKKCGSCEKTVDVKEVVEKSVKIGKQRIIIPKEKLDSIKDNVAKDESKIQINTFVERNFELPLHLIEGSKWVGIAKKHTKDFVELKELCKDYYFVGEAIFRSNSYQIAITLVGDDLVVIKLAEKDRTTNKPSTEDADDLTIKPSETRVTILKELAVKEFEFGNFADERQEQVDELIEKIDMGEEVEVEARETVVADEDEEAKLREILLKIRKEKGEV